MTEEMIGVPSCAEGTNPRCDRLKRRWPGFKAALAAGTALAAFCLAFPALAEDINTIGDWNGISYISLWGVPNTATYGQTITASTTQSVLHGFTFELQKTSGTAPDYQAFVYRWDDATQRIVGPALFSSGILTAPDDSAFMPVSIDTGSIVLVPSEQYVLFLTTSTVTGQANASYRYGALTNNTTYAGGQFVYQNNGTDFSQLMASNWSNIAQDLAFIALLTGGFDGQSAIGVQLASEQLMNQFLAVMLDPFGPSGGGAADSGAPLGYAGQRQPAPSELALGYATGAGGASPKAAYNIWAAAYGGYTNVDGDSVPATDTHTGGITVGFDGWLTPDTNVGAAVGFGHMSWDTAEDLGDGDGDAFQGGLYGRHLFGPFYVAGALAAAYEDVSTHRIGNGGMDVLEADYDAYSLAGRLEGGYRIPLQDAALTPYGAVQVQHLHTPAYSETVVSGPGLSAQSFASSNTTSTRTELGLWGEIPLQADAGAAVSIYGRLAWAHNFGDEIALNAAYLSFPGSTTTFTGAAQASDLALVTLGAKASLNGGWSALARFDGEFGDGTQSYSGKGKLTYTW